MNVLFKNIFRNRSCVLLVYALRVFKLFLSLVSEFVALSLNHIGGDSSLESDLKTQTLQLTNG
jgi:hypothetical protein